MDTWIGEIQLLVNQKKERQERLKFVSPERARA